MSRHQEFRCVLRAFLVFIVVPGIPVSMLEVPLQPAALAAETSDAAILNFTTVPIRTGQYSIFARFQSRLAAALNECGMRAAANQVQGEKGVFGEKTSHAIRELTKCRGYRGLPATARRGVLSEALWSAVLGDGPRPSLDDRIAAIVLTFEATDFGDEPEWNFCQDSKDPLGVAARSREGPPAQCFNSTDPCSFLTWGPRGATAGQGREIQWILSNVARRSPEALKNAFGNEYPSVLRFVRLQGPPVEACDGTTALEYFMCAIWTDPARRATWQMALTRLGRSALVRDVFRQVYALESFDGYKIKAYYALWSAIGVRPSEIDLAFFRDRATHIGAPPLTLTAAMLLTCIGRQPAGAAINAAARRCLSELHPHPAQPRDRKGRDVAFYIDAFPKDTLSVEELQTWDRHIPVSAERNFALSDVATVPIGDALQPAESNIVPPVFDDDRVTEVERSCRAAILKPLPVPAAPQPAN